MSSVEMVLNRLSLGDLLEEELRRLTAEEQLAGSHGSAGTAPGPSCGGNRQEGLFANTRAKEDSWSCKERMSATESSSSELCTDVPDARQTNMLGSEQVREDNPGRDLLIDIEKESRQPTNSNSESKDDSFLLDTSLTDLLTESTEQRFFQRKNVQTQRSKARVKRSRNTLDKSSEATANTKQTVPVQDEHSFSKWRFRPKSKSKLNHTNSGLPVEKAGTSLPAPHMSHSRKVSVPITQSGNEDGHSESLSSNLNFGISQNFNRACDFLDDINDKMEDEIAVGSNLQSVCTDKVPASKEVRPPGDLLSDLDKEHGNTVSTPVVRPQQDGTSTPRSGVSEKTIGKLKQFAFTQSDKDKQAHSSEEKVEAKEKLSANPCPNFSASLFSGGLWLDNSLDSDLLGNPHEEKQCPNITSNQNSNIKPARNMKRAAELLKRGFSRRTVENTTNMQKSTRTAPPSGLSITGDNSQRTPTAPPSGLAISGDNSQTSTSAESLPKWMSTTLRNGSPFFSSSNGDISDDDLDLDTPICSNKKPRLK